VRDSQHGEATSFIYATTPRSTAESRFTPSTEPRKQRSGTREFRLDDPDGNTLAFFAK
jgi:hypothetical protein